MKWAIFLLLYFLFMIYTSIQYFSQRYLTTFGGNNFVVGLTPLASRKARSDLSQRRKVSGLTPAARESSDLVQERISFAFYLILHCFLSHPSEGTPKELRRNSAATPLEETRNWLVYTIHSTPYTLHSVAVLPRPLNSRRNAPSTKHYTSWYITFQTYP